MPNLKGGILYSRCPCIETRHLARQVGGASAGFFFIKFIDKFVVLSFKVIVELSFFRIKIYAKFAGQDKVSVCYDQAELSGRDDSEKEGKGSFGVLAVSWPRLRS